MAYCVLSTPVRSAGSTSLDEKVYCACAAQQHRLEPYGVLKIGKLRTDYALSLVI